MAADEEGYTRDPEGDGHERLVEHDGVGGPEGGGDGSSGSRLATVSEIDGYVIEERISPQPNQYQGQGPGQGQGLDQSPTVAANLTGQANGSFRVGQAQESDRCVHAAGAVSQKRRLRRHSGAE